MIAQRFILAHPEGLPEHLLPDVEHALGHAGWLHIRQQRYRLGPVAVCAFRGATGPLLPARDELLTALAASLDVLGVAYLHRSGRYATQFPASITVLAEGFTDDAATRVLTDCQLRLDPAGYPVYVTDQPAAAPADALALRLPAGGGQDHSPKNQQTALLQLLALLGYGAPTE